MKLKLTEKEIKQYSFAILKDIKKVCEELKLTYFLDGGTLLGAIRHNGFIPWDDDIDVSMPRPDYEIFIREYNKYCNKNYKLKSITTDLKYGIPYAKISDTTTILYKFGRNAFGQGLSVDIFPIDAYPNTQDEQKSYLNKSLALFKSYASTVAYAYSNYNTMINVIINKNIRVLVPVTDEEATTLLTVGDIVKLLEKKAK